MKVDTIMYHGPRVAVVDASDCLRDVLEELNRKSLGGVCVVNGERLVGIITDGDIRRLILNTQKSLPHLFLMNASEVMVRDPQVVAMNTSLDECLSLLQRYRIWVVPVVGEGRVLLGMVHLHELLKSLQPACSSRG